VAPVHPLSEEFVHAHPADPVCRRGGLLRFLAHAADAVSTAASGPAPGRAAAAERFKALDTNGDGRISRAEAQAAPALAAHFDQIDANKDGQVTPKEFRAYHRTLKDAKASGGGATPAPAGASPSWTRTATAS
jgi:hypothetical protein